MSLRHISFAAALAVATMASSMASALTAYNVSFTASGGAINLVAKVFAGTPDVNGTSAVTNITGTLDYPGQPHTTITAISQYGSGAKTINPGGSGTDFSFTTAFDAYQLFWSDIFGEFEINDHTTNPAGIPLGTGGTGSISAAAVPEPATWGLMIVGFGVVGALARRKHTIEVAA